MSALAAYVHDFSPFLVYFGEGFFIEGIRWYGTAFLAGFGVSYLIVRAMTRAHRSPLAPEQAGDFVVMIALATMVGGRVGYCLFYQPALFLDFSGNVPFWGVLKMNQGGMSFHGGLLGVAAMCGWYAWRHRLPFGHLADLCALGATVGIFFGRLANFINGELYGRPAPDDLPWGMKFPQEMREWGPKAQYENLAEIVPLVGVSQDQWRAWFAATGPDRDAAVALTRGTIESLIFQVQQGNPEVTQALHRVLTTLHPSQLYEAIAEGLIAFLILMLVWSKPRKPGVIGGLFLIVYGVGRSICEFYREPDSHIAHLEAAQIGLTRGQLLSITMILLGIPIIIWMQRRPTPRLGGWRPGIQVDLSGFQSANPDSKANSSDA